jgi:hypothetical protein
VVIDVAIFVNYIGYSSTANQAAVGKRYKLPDPMSGLGGAELIFEKLVIIET